MKHILKTISNILIILCFFTGTAFADIVTFYHTDPAGTPIAMSSAKGKIVWKADYKPFGEEKSITGTFKNNKRLGHRNINWKKSWGHPIVPHIDPLRRQRKAFAVFWL
jgi:hypothetical protein